MKAHGSGTNGYRRLYARAKDGDGETFVRLRRFARWLRHVGRGLCPPTLIPLVGILTTPQLVEVVTWNQLGIHIKRTAEHSSPFRFFTHTYRSDCRTKRSGVLQPPPTTHPKRHRRWARPGRKQAPRHVRRRPVFGPRRTRGIRLGRCCTRCARSVARAGRAHVQPRLDRARASAQRCAAHGNAAASSVRPCSLRQASNVYMC
jgi:hypothetical protein